MKAKRADQQFKSKKQVGAFVSALSRFLLLMLIDVWLG
jgi:hypothetical protein